MNLGTPVKRAFSHGHGVALDASSGDVRAEVLRVDTDRTYPTSTGTPDGPPIVRFKRFDVASNDGPDTNRRPSMSGLLEDPPESGVTVG
jgi:hypothetical protein